MPEHKKHHYVPRFYLKRFSQDGKSVNIFNIKSKRLILNGKLKTQCYRNYFYGEDQQAEKGLAIVECHSAAIISRMAVSEILPAIQSEDRLLLTLYVLMQHTRTAYAADSLDEQTDKFMKYVMAHEIEKMGITKEELKHIQITRTDSARWALASATPFYPLLMDLDWKLLRAGEMHEFITSDNPVVYYNQLLYFRNHGSNTGLSTKGLQIFFPLDNRHVLLMYDGNVYGVGTRKSQLVQVDDGRDIEHINRLQYVSALENIYFHGNSFPAAKHYAGAEKYRRKQKSRMQIFPSWETENERSELLMMSREDVKTDLDLSFVRLIKPAKRWLHWFKKLKSQPAAVIRNEPLHGMHERFMELVDKKKYLPGEFFKYVHDLDRS